MYWHVMARTLAENVEGLRRTESCLCQRGKLLFRATSATRQTGPSTEDKACLEANTILRRMYSPTEL
eukprot:scaffold400266_cov46-Prasinocladus_malaysianus.AAC.1